MNNSFEINIDFVNDLRLYYSIMILNFDENIKEIVPQQLTHHNLSSNNNIDKFILKFYYSPTSRFITDEEFQEIVSTGYLGNKETTFTPYSFMIYGAYHTRIGLFYKLKHIKEFGLTINKKPIKYLNDLIPYFKEYRNGFECGFNEFEKECINPFLPMFPDKSDFTDKVFDYVTKDIIFSHSWFNNHSGFRTTQDNDILIDKAFEDGRKQGFFYKAWTLILSNSNLFAPLFRERFEEKNNNENDLKQNIELTQLLERKKELKNSIKRTEEKIIAQKEAVLKQKQRAEVGKTNTLAFEQRELPKFESEKITLEKELSNLKIIIKTLKHNNEIEKESQQLVSIKTDEVKPKKIAEKWYALLYWIELSANGEQPPRSIEGTFIKSEIEKIGREITGTTGQSFYRKFIEIDLNNERLISSVYGKDWKDKIIELSNNNQLVVRYIENKYTSS